jgi:serine protease Do
LLIRGFLKAVAENQPTEEQHTVSSAPAPRQGKNISFTIPTMPRISWRNIAARTRTAWLAIVLVLGLAGGYFGGLLQSHTGDGLVTGSVSEQKKIVTNQGELVSSIAKTVGPSVVSVNVNVTDNSSNGLDDFFGFQQPQQEQAAGTGIIINSDGLVLTNRHVVPQGTTSVSVTLSDGTQLNNVTVVGRTTTSDSLDIAILKINDTKGHKLQPATLGNSSQVNVGDEVVAIGNALGQFQNTVTSGIISGYGRSITAGADNGSGGVSSSDTENLDNLFQTDAAINEGNSGGPLVNLNGQVIGINTAIASGSQNIGFAIPINDVKGLVEHVLATGKFERPYLGVRYIPLTADVAKEYGLSVSDGAYIAPAADASTPSVVSGSPADKAGLKEGDIITKVGGTAVDEDHSLTALLGKYQPSDKVTLTVVNGSKTRSVGVTLGIAPTGSAATQQ